MKIPTAIFFKICFGYLVFFSVHTEAKTFNTAYLNFEIPDRWNCALESTEWICRADDPKERKEAVIILTAKEVGPTDSYAIYEGHLNTPQPMQGRKDSGITSVVRTKVQKYNIGNQQWVDGFHDSSEVENYFTRYLATIKEQVAVLITFSAHKTVYSKYSADFNKAIQSLQVKAVKNIYAGNTQGVRPADGQIFGGQIKDAMAGLSDGSDLEEPVEESANSSLMGAIVGLLVLAAAAFLFLKKKKS